MHVQLHAPYRAWTICIVLQDEDSSASARSFDPDSAQRQAAEKNHRAKQLSRMIASVNDVLFNRTGVYYVVAPLRGLSSNHGLEKSSHTRPRVSTPRAAAASI